MALPAANKTFVDIKCSPHPPNEVLSTVQSPSFQWHLAWPACLPHESAEHTEQTQASVAHPRLPRIAAMPDLSLLSQALVWLLVFPCCEGCDRRVSAPPL